MKKISYVKTKNNKQFLSYGSALVFLGLMLFALTANAQAPSNLTVGDIAVQIKSQIPGVLNVMEAIAYIGGLGLGVKGIMKLRENNESKGKVPLTTPIIMIVAAVILLALPTAINTGIFGLGLQGGTNAQGQTQFTY